MLVMEEQISILITILAALLTGGFLMIFIESQQVAYNMSERFHFIMRPFLHSFTNYTKFIASFKSCFRFRGTETETNMGKLVRNLELISKLGENSILSGQEYPTDYFSSKQLNSVCESINDIWNRIDKDYNGFLEVEFDSHSAKIQGKTAISYLEEVSPKYKGVQLTKDLLGEVSGDFYVNFYQPIEHILFEYEYWLKKEKQFKTLAMVTITITIFTMLILLLFRHYIPIWILTSLCVSCCGLLLFELYMLMRLEDLTKKIMR